MRQFPLEPTIVEDGDTVFRRDGDKVTTIRDSGSDTPETVFAFEPGGGQSSIYAKRRLADGASFGPQTGTTYGREVRDIFTSDGTRLSSEVIQRGLASATDFGGDTWPQDSARIRNLTDILGRETGRITDAEDPEQRSAREQRLNRFMAMANGRYQNRMSGFGGNTPYGTEGAVSDSWERGKAELRLTGSAFVQAVGSFAGYDPMERFGAEGVEGALADAVANPARIGSVSNVDFTDYQDVGLYVLETLVAESPSLLVDAGAALATSGGSVFVAGVGKAALRGLGGAAAAASPGLVSKQAAKRGLQAGAFGSMYVQNTGETYNAQLGVGHDNPERAFLVGLGKTSLDYASLKGVLGDVSRRFNSGSDVDSIAKWFGSTLGAIAGSSSREGVTEMTQALVDELNKVELTDGEYQINEQALIDSLAAGTVVGGGLSGAGAAAGNTMQLATSADARSGRNREPGVDPRADTFDAVREARSRGESVRPNVNRSDDGTISVTLGDNDLPDANVAVTLTREEKRALNMAQHDKNLAETEEEAAAADAAMVEAVQPAIDRTLVEEGERANLSNTTTEPEPISQLKATYDSFGRVYVAPENTADGLTVDAIREQMPDAQVYEMDDGGVVFANDPSKFEGLSPDMTGDALGAYLGMIQTKTEALERSRELGVEPVVVRELNADGKAVLEQVISPDRVQEAEAAAQERGNSTEVTSPKVVNLERKKAYREESEFAFAQREEAAGNPAPTLTPREQADRDRQVQEEQAAIDAAREEAAGGNTSYFSVERRAAVDDMQAEATANLEQARSTFVQELDEATLQQQTWDETRQQNPQDERGRRLSFMTQELKRLGGDPNAFIEDSGQTDREALLALLNRERNQEGAVDNRNTVDGYEGYTLNDLLGDNNLSDMTTAQLEALANKLRMSEIPKKVESLSPARRGLAKMRLRDRIASLRSEKKIPNDVSGLGAVFPKLAKLSRDKGSQTSDEFTQSVLNALPSDRELDAYLKNVGDGELMTALYQAGAKMSPENKGDKTGDLRPSALSPSSNRDKQGRVSGEKLASEKRLNVEGLAAEIQRLSSTTSQDRSKNAPTDNASNTPRTSQRSRDQVVMERAKEIVRQSDAAGSPFNADQAVAQANREFDAGELDNQSRNNTVESTRTTEVVTGAIERRADEIVQRAVAARDAVGAQMRGLPGKIVNASRGKERSAHLKKQRNLQRKFDSVKIPTREQALEQAHQEYERGELDSVIESQQANAEKGGGYTEREARVAEEMGITEEEANELFDAAAVQATIYGLTEDRGLANNLARKFVASSNLKLRMGVGRAANLYKQVAGRMGSVKDAQGSPFLRTLLSQDSVDPTVVDQRVKKIEKQLRDDPEAAAQTIYDQLRRLPQGRRAQMASLQGATDHNTKNSDDTFRGNSNVAAGTQTANIDNGRDNELIDDGYSIEEPDRYREKGLGDSAVNPTTSSYIGGDDTSASEQSDRNFFGSTLSAALFVLDHNGAMVPFTGRDVSAMIPDDINPATGDRSAQVNERVHRTSVQRKVESTNRTERHRSKNIARLDMVVQGANGHEVQGMHFDMVEVVSYGERGEPSPQTAADYYRAYLRNMSRLSAGLTASHDAAQAPFFKQALINNFNMNSDLVIAGDTAETAITLGEAREAYRKELADSDLAVELATENDRVNIEREEIVPVLESYLALVEERQYMEEEALAARKASEDKGIPSDEGDEGALLGLVKLRLDIEEKLGFSSRRQDEKLVLQQSPDSQAPRSAAGLTDKGSEATFRERRVAKLKAQYETIAFKYGADSPKAVAAARRVQVAEGISSDSPQALQAMLDNATEYKSQLEATKASLEERLAYQEANTPEDMSVVTHAENKAQTALVDFSATLTTLFGKAKSRFISKKPPTDVDITLEVHSEAYELAELRTRRPADDTLEAEYRQARHRILSRLLGDGYKAATNSSPEVAAMLTDAINTAMDVYGPLKQARVAHTHDIIATKGDISEVDSLISRVDASIAKHTAALESAQAEFVPGQETPAKAPPKEVEEKRPNLSLITHRGESPADLNLGPYTDLKAAIDGFDRVNRKGRELRARLRDFYSTTDDTNKAVELFSEAYVGMGYTHREARLMAARDVEVTDAFIGKDETAFDQKEWDDEIAPVTGRNDDETTSEPLDVSGDVERTDINQPDAEVSVYEPDPNIEITHAAHVRAESKETAATLEAKLEEYKKQNPEAHEAFVQKRKDEWLARNPEIHDQIDALVTQRAEEMEAKGEEVTEDTVIELKNQAVDEAYMESPDVYIDSYVENTPDSDGNYSATSTRSQPLFGSGIERFYHFVNLGRLDTFRGISPQNFMLKKPLASHAAQAVGGFSKLVPTAVDRFFGKPSETGERANGNVRYEGLDAQDTVTRGFVNDLLSRFKVSDRPTLMTVGRTVEQTITQLRDAGLITAEQEGSLRNKLEQGVVDANDVEPMYISLGDYSVITMPSRPKGIGRPVPDNLAVYRWYHQLGHEIGHMIFDEYKSSILSRRKEVNTVAHTYESLIGRPIDSPQDMIDFDEWFADNAANEAIARFLGVDYSEGVARTKPIFGGIIDKMTTFYKRLNEVLAPMLGSATRRYVRTTTGKKMFLEMADNIQRGKYYRKAARPNKQRQYLSDIYMRRHADGDSAAARRAAGRANIHENAGYAAMKKGSKAVGKGATAVARNMFADTVFRIGRYSKDLQQALHQRTGAARNNEGRAAFSQMEEAISRSLRGELTQAINKIAQQQGKKKLSAKELRQALQDYERTGQGPLADFMAVAEQKARRGGFKSIPTRLTIPAALNHEGVMQNESAFMDLLREAFPNDKPNKLDQRLQILQMSQGMSEFSVAPGLPVGMHDTTRVLIEKIGYERLRDAGFLHEKSEAALLHFIDGLAKRTAWEGNFGGYTSDTQLNYDRFLVGGDRDRVAQLEAMELAKMEDGELLMYDPSAKYHKHLDDIEQRHGVGARRDVEDMMQGAMGVKTGKVPKAFRSTNDWVVGFVQKTILAMAGVMSLAETAMPIINSHGRGNVISGLSGFSAGRQMAIDLGIIVSDTMDNIAYHSQGDNYESSTLRKIDQVYFKAIGMKLVMDTTRALGVSFGTQYLIRSAELGDSAALSRYGLTAGDVQTWVRNGKPTTLNSGNAVHDGVHEKVHSAISQFVSESSATPNRFQAPNWFNNPYMKVFWMVKRYMYAYADNLIGGMIRNTKSQWDRGNGYADKAILASLPFAMFGLFMMPMAAASDELRERMRPYMTGREGKHASDHDSFGKYMLHVFDRTGGFGPVGMALQMRKQSEWGLSPFEASSPVFAKASLLYDWGEGGYSNEKAVTRARHFVPILSQTPALWHKVFD